MAEHNSFLSAADSARLDTAALAMPSSALIAAPMRWSDGDVS